MKVRSDSWAAAMSDDAVEKAFQMCLGFTPRHRAIPELVAAFNCAKPSKTAFYRWLAVVESEAWRWRLKHAVSVAKTMEQALPDDADSIYRNALVALGVDAAVGSDPKIAIAIGRTLKALNKDRESRLTAQIVELKARIAQITEAAQQVNAPLDPARLAAEVDAVLGRRVKQEEGDAGKGEAGLARTAPEASTP
jgi:hypothetical protein